MDPTPSSTTEEERQLVTRAVDALCRLGGRNGRAEARERLEQMVAADARRHRLPRVELVRSACWDIESAVARRERTGVEWHGRTPLKIYMHPRTLDRRER